MPSPLDLPEEPTPSTTPAPPTPDPAAAVPSLVTDTPSATASLAIEPPRPQAEAADDVRTMDLGEGTVIRLDKLGPMIVNSDGTLSRIQNWQDLHPIEQERTVRLLVKKRNLVRMAKLDAEGAGAGEEQVSALAAAKGEGGAAQG